MKLNKRIAAGFLACAMAVCAFAPCVSASSGGASAAGANASAQTAAARDVTAEKAAFLAKLKKDGVAEVGAYHVEKIKDGIYHMDEGTDALPGGAYDASGAMNNPSSIYLVEKANKLLIVDAGNMPEKGSSKETDAKVIIEAMADGKEEVSIAITHNHYDHTGLIANGNILSGINISHVYMSKDDYEADEVVKSAYSEPVVTLLEEGSTFEFAGDTYDVIEISAHTAGSLVYVNKADNVLFTGDTIGSGFVWLFWLDGTDPLGIYETGIKELQDVVKNLDSQQLRILAGHRWQQFWEANAERPGEMTVQYLNDMSQVLSGLQNGTTKKSEYSARGNTTDIELSSNGCKAKIDTTPALVDEYIDGVNSYDKVEAYIFSEADTLSIETENNVNAAKFLIYVDGHTDKDAAQKLVDELGISDIIKKSASTAIVVNAKSSSGKYTDEDVDIFIDLLQTKIGPTSNLNLIGIGKGATFINQKLSQYDWGVAGIMTYGGKAGAAPKYSVPTYVSNSRASVAKAYKKANNATSETTNGTITTSVNPDNRFEIVVENSAKEDVATAFQNAWTNVLSKFGRIGNISREDGAVGTWYLKTNDVEREFQYFDSVDAITNVERTIVTKDLDGDGVDSLWYVYMPEQSKNAVGTVPVVFLMHGNTNDPRTQWDTSGWANIASEEGVILVCPEWQGHTYQGYTYDPMTDDTNYTPESDFTKCVKDVLASYPQIDQSRVYISGLSAGCRNTTNNSLVNTKYFAAGAGQSGPFINTDSNYAKLKSQVEANADSLDMPIIYFSGDKDEYLSGDFDKLSMTGALQDVQLFQELNNMAVTSVADLKAEYGEVYGIPFDTYGKVENEGLCEIVGGTMTNAKGVEISVNRIKDWGHWNYPADAELMWNFMKKYSRNPATGELSIAS